jgi:hypothetical protein
LARLYFDHNVALQLADLLKQSSHDVLVADEAGLAGADDDEHLLFSADARRALITHNAKDFVLLHAAWRRWSRAWDVAAEHAGVLVVAQRPFAELARELDAFLANAPPLTNELYRWRTASGWSRQS